MNDLAISLEAVSFSSEGRLVLDEVLIEVDRGTTTALVGPVGGGKTTLLRVIAGMVRPTSGVARVLGADLASLGYDGMRAHRLRIGFAFESTGLLGNASIGDNVALPLRYHQGARLGHAAVLERVRAVAEELGIESHLAERSVLANASVRKRALVARALVLEPELLLCDEPQVGLTQREARRVADALERRRRERAMTMVMTDHDGWLDPYLADHTVYIDGGRLRTTPTLRPSEIDEALSDPMPERFSLSLVDIYGGSTRGSSS